jgi:hypothetical protein
MEKSIPLKVETRFKDWEVLEYKRFRLVKPILIEGMPGIGNVGKICMDLMIEDTKASLFMSFFSYGLPNSVFVNEENLVELPNICLYYKKINRQDYLFLTGDVQPMTEKSSYEFSEIIMELFKRFNGQYIITLGGIGLGDIPEFPKVYLTGNNKEFVDKVSKSMIKKKLKHETKIYGLVGPILGISGLLLGVSKKYKTNAFSLLAETFGHPIYVGLKGSKSILGILNEYLNLGLKFDRLDKEISIIDAQMKGLGNDIDPHDTLGKYRKYSDINYIG